MQEIELLVRVGGDDGVCIELLIGVWGTVSEFTTDVHSRENVARRTTTRKCLLYSIMLQVPATQHDSITDGIVAARLEHDSRAL